MSKKTIPPSKVIITMGVKITNCQFSGKVSGVDLLNANIALLRDTNKMTGMAYKEMFAIIDEALGTEVFRKKPTMDAGLSNKTAKGE